MNASHPAIPAPAAVLGAGLRYEGSGRLGKRYGEGRPGDSLHYMAMARMVGSASRLVQPKLGSRMPGNVRLITRLLPPPSVCTPCCPAATGGHQFPRHGLPVKRGHRLPGKCTDGVLCGAVHRLWRGVHCSAPFPIQLHRGTCRLRPCCAGCVVLLSTATACSRCRRSGVRGGPKAWETCC